MAHFTINNNFQKRDSKYSDILTGEILKDVCKRITGQEEYSWDFIDAVNVGRLAVLEHNGVKSYISFSEDSIAGRNSSFQSLPSAFTRFTLDGSSNKNMYFYFLPAEGSYESPYFSFMYRLMTTAGITILNSREYLNYKVQPFTSVEDLINSRESNRSRNRSNNSTYVTRDENNKVQIYGKTYGASKKESTLLCVALSKITESEIDLYQITEQNLTTLPAPDMAVIESLGNINVVVTDITLERREYEAENSLRSPSFIYNLLVRLGPKKCTLCECEIPELIQGAHIWAVSDIKRSQMDEASKIEHAINGDNGMWLCQNHHKLFDTEIISFDLSGRVSVDNRMGTKDAEYIGGITSKWQIDNEQLNDGVLGYIRQRYRLAQTA